MLVIDSPTTRGRRGQMGRRGRAASQSELDFPAGGAQPANINDFPAGTGFGSIDFTSFNYDITGNGLRLSAGDNANLPTAAVAANTRTRMRVHS